VVRLLLYGQRGEGVGEGLKQVGKAPNTGLLDGVQTEASLDLGNIFLAQRAAVNLRQALVLRTVADCRATQGMKVGEQELSGISASSQTDVTRMRVGRSDCFEASMARKIPSKSSSPMPQIEACSS